MSIDELRAYKPEPDCPLSRLEIRETGEGLIVGYHCEEPEELGSFLPLLAGVADDLAEFHVSGEDSGANGTRNWDLGPLLDCEARFPKLRAFEMEATKPGDHNRTIVTCHDSYDEAGGLGRLLSSAPALERLVTPSAPERGFFEGERVLRDLVIHVGYAHHGFVKQLASSDCFPHLAALEYCDYSETYMEDFEEHLTPAEDFAALFETTKLPSLKKLRLVNASCADQEALRSMPLARQLAELRFDTLLL